MKTGNLLLRVHRLTWIAGMASFVLVLGIAGSAAAVRQESMNGNVLLRGVRVGSVDLEGLDYDAARKRLRSAFDAPLDEPVQVNLDGRPLTTTTRRELGVQTDVEEVLRRAMLQHTQMSPVKRLWYRITGMTVGTKLSVETSFDDGPSGSFVDRVAEQVYKAPVDAGFSLAGDRIKIRPEEPGFRLDQERAGDAISKALDSGGPINLSGVAVAPGVTSQSLKDIIVVKVGENKLNHYRNGALMKTYTVATGLPRYPTPIGTFKIVEKRFRPTWVNPARGKGEWGEKLPARIGPGPGNPLGTRAMNLNSPGIRIHGTQTDASLGFNASHGCIRMRMSDVEELFDRVSVGTPVMIIRSGPIRVYQPTAAPTLEQLVESDGAALAGLPAPTPAPATPAPQASPAPGPTAQPAPSPDPLPTALPTPDPAADGDDGLDLSLNLPGIGEE